MKGYSNGTTTYYRYRKDSATRLQFLKPEWIRDRHVLDIGCNTGDLTLQIAHSLTPSLIEGIDVDYQLIKDAQRKRSNVVKKNEKTLGLTLGLVRHCNVTAARTRAESTPQPVGPVGPADKAEAEVQVEARQQKPPPKSAFAFVPRVLSHKKPATITATGTTTAAATAATTTTTTTTATTATATITTTSREKKKPFPMNVIFKAVDICSDGHTCDLSKECYDTILCLSVTKWIHLNSGDAGLKMLFRKSFELLAPNGVFVLEYQPWKSYIKNRNTSAVTKSNFPLLTIRPEDFESLLEAEGFVIEERLGTPLSEAKGFNRPILVLTKRVEKSIGGDKCLKDSEYLNKICKGDTSEATLIAEGSAKTKKKRKLHEVEGVNCEISSESELIEDRKETKKASKDRSGDSRKSKKKKKKIKDAEETCD